MSPNKLVLSLTGNDTLREAMASKAPGDEIEMEVTVKLDESTGEQAQFSVVEANVIQEPAEEPESEDMGMEAEMEGEDMGKESKGDAAALLVFGKGGKGI